MVGRRIIANHIKLYIKITANNFFLNIIYVQIKQKNIYMQAFFIFEALECYQQFKRNMSGVKSSS